MRTAISEHIRSNRKKYMFLLMAYILGMLLGYICLGLFSDEVIAELTSYMGENFKLFLSYSESLDNAQYFKEVFLGESLSFLIMWVLGLSVLGVFYSPLFMLYKGYILGFACAFMLKSFDGKGLIFDILVLVSQNLVKVPVLLFAGMCTMSHSLKRSSGGPGGKNISSAGSMMIVYSIYMLIALLVYCAGIYIECYIIPHFVFLLAKDMI